MIHCRRCGNKGCFTIVDEDNKNEYWECCVCGNIETVPKVDLRRIPEGIGESA